MNEKSLIRSILVVPVLMILFFLLIMGGVFSYLIKNFEEEQLRTSISELLKTKKETLQSQIEGVNQDIKLDLKFLEDRVKYNLELDVDTMADVVEDIYSQTHSFKMIKDLIDKINLKRGDNYFFIFQKESGKILIHPIKKFIGISGKDIKFGPFTAYELGNQAINNKRHEGYFEINFYKPNNNKHLYKKIVWVKWMTDLGWVIGSGEYLDNIKKIVRGEIIQKILLKRYGKGHYFFVIDLKNGVSYTPINTFYINFDDIVDVKGNHFVKNIIETAKKGGGFVKYWWFNPIDNKIEEKISYVKYNKDLNLIVGSGTYISELDSFIKKNRERIANEFNKLNNTFKFFLILIILFSLLISTLISNKLKNLFKMYNEKLKEEKEKAEFSANHDPLTGAYNRQFFNKKIEEEIELFKRYKNKFSICLLDLDHFKKINDTFGHDVGDKVLKTFVNFLSKNIRKTDFLARWGGEEFIIIFPETDVKGAYKKCQELRKRLKEIDKPVDFTFSAGVSEVRDGDAVETIFKKIDIALYKAKEKRDDVEILV